MKNDTKPSSTPSRVGMSGSSEFIPHQGALCRVLENDQDFEQSYVIHIEIPIVDGNVYKNGSIRSEQTTLHELVFNRHDFEFASRVFAILDSESTSLVDRQTVQEFVYRRCPVFWRRDEDLIEIGFNYKSDNNAKVKKRGTDRNITKSSPTFDEIWQSVIACSRNKGPSGHKKKKGSSSGKTIDAQYLGLEGWMVFFRFIALAQYLEAKRRFSARHLQQTMRHRNSPRGSEMVVVDVPPAEPPVPLSPTQLAGYEKSNKAPLPAPELDLDHSLLAAHDCHVNRFGVNMPFQIGRVKITLFGAGNSSNGPNGLEFAVVYSQQTSVSSSGAEEVVVRRSMTDMKWLDETFSSHKVLGGTLCGRILPPFPGSSSVTSKVLSSHFHDESNSSILPSSMSIKKTTGSAINVAAAGAGKIRDVAKSFFGGYLPSSSSSKTSSRNVDDNNVSPGSIAVSGSKPAPKISKAKQTNSRSSISIILPENYYNPNSPTGKARQLERYLNYLLEHPALSTSFPLNTILKASQSGLDAAKQCLDECTRVSKELKDRTPQLVDGKVGIPLFSPTSPNFGWVRTAAQAAIALRVHGMLETSGLPSASARLQHASLPSFGNVSARSNSGWEDIEIEAGIRMTPNNTSLGHVGAGSNFEEGVINDDGFDLLPLPVPAPERRILCAGSNSDSNVAFSERRREERFHYGSDTLQGRYTIDEDDNVGAAYLGDVAVDENIDKLREVIGSVDNTLSRCLACSGGIGKAQREKQNLHLGIVGGLDSWAGMRGKFVSQRSLLKGVAGIEQSKAIAEEGDLALIDDLCWQTSLASSAVSAAEDVRAAVRASRTASNARATASSAALAAQQACEKGEFKTMEEARAAQTRASIAQSHAIHAAVVEHEAKTVKRRATLALAHDVKTWNIHRKREMLRTCLAYAKSQHEASRRAVDSWSSLVDGFIGSPAPPTTVDRRQIVAHSPPPIQSERRRAPYVEPDEVTATIFESIDSTSNLNPTIVAVDHNILSSAVIDTASEMMRSIEVVSPETFLPFADVAPIPEEEEESVPAPVLRREDFESEHPVNLDRGVLLQESCAHTVADSIFLNDFLDFHPNTQTTSVNEGIDGAESRVNESILAKDKSQSSSKLDFLNNESNHSQTIHTTPTHDDDVVGDLIDFRKGFSRHERPLQVLSPRKAK